jgi:hypothetical protein
MDACMTMDDGQLSIVHRPSSSFYGRIARRAVQYAEPDAVDQQVK